MVWVNKSPLRVRAIMRTIVRKSVRRNTTAARGMAIGAACVHNEAVKITRSVHSRMNHFHGKICEKHFSANKLQWTYGRA